MVPENFLHLFFPQNKSYVKSSPKIKIFQKNFHVVRSSRKAVGYLHIFVNCLTLECLYPEKWLTVIMIICTFHKLIFQYIKVIFLLEQEFNLMLKLFSFYLTFKNSLIFCTIIMEILQNSIYFISFYYKNNLIKFEFQFILILVVRYFTLLFTFQKILRDNTKRNCFITIRELIFSNP